MIERLKYEELSEFIQKTILTLWPLQSPRGMQVELMYPSSPLKIKGLLSTG